MTSKRARPPAAGKRKSRSSVSDRAGDHPDDPVRTSWERAVRLLAARDRSEHEIRTRLAAGGVSARTIAATLTRLRELHYADDERLAQGVAAAAAQRGHGSQRVRAELTAKGVANTLIDAALQTSLSDEVTLARQVLARRYPTPPASTAERAKAARFLLQRGFPESIVLAILEEGC